jgi:hypothetical protein
MGKVSRRLAYDALAERLEVQARVARAARILRVGLNPPRHLQAQIDASRSRGDNGVAAALELVGIKWAAQRALSLLTELEETPPVEVVAREGSS